MKLIVAIIRPEKLQAVREALDEMDVSLMYAGGVSDGWRTRQGRYRGLEFRIRQPKIRLEILIVNDMAVSGVVNAINRAATIARPDSAPAATSW